ncbi:hypothetical protein GCM10027342_41770 [Photobacterium alginatilyticum]
MKIYGNKLCELADTFQNYCIEMAKLAMRKEVTHRNGNSWSTNLVKPLTQFCPEMNWDLHVLDRSLTLIRLQGDALKASCKKESYR